MLKINDLVGVVFSGLSDLVIEDAVVVNNLIQVMARTRDEPVPCRCAGC